MRAAILLAAGGSRRFGATDKLTQPLGRRPLVLHALDQARRAGTHRIIVVVPSSGGRVGRLLRASGLQLVTARHHRDGIGATLAAGLAVLRPIDRDVLIFLADMPFALVHPKLRLTPGMDAIRPVTAGKPGHPMLARSAVARLFSPRGDRGLAASISPGRIAKVPGTWANLFDVDTPAALRTARRRLAADRRRLRC